MYLVRKGELQVFIPVQGQEVNLAKIESGGLIGEMSLFDNKPRSASVRALTEVEVTVITTDDFSKLMKQIPKWFVSLMSALSTRLRETNDRLQGVESKLKGNIKPFENVFRVLNIVLLLFHKDGNKQDKNWAIDRSEAEAATAKILDLTPETVTKIIDASVEGKLFNLAKTGYGKQSLSISNRGNIDRFIAFLAKFMANNLDRKPMPDGVVALLESADRLAKKSAYETVTVAFDDVVAEGERAALRTKDWKTLLPLFKDIDDSIAIVKVSNGGVGFRLVVKNFSRCIDYFKVMNAIQSKGAA
jgi:CRP-like cAMP-binding protein